MSPTTNTTVAAVAALAAIAGCSRPAIDAARFHNRDPVWVVDDRRDVPRKPAENRFVKMLYHFDGFYHRRFVRWTEQRPRRRALNVNALGEVPDSTWFTNRIGVREMSVDEVRRGPNREPGPMAFKPWTIKSSKVGGVSVGFIIEDSAGERYLLKFDGKDHPELETASDVIVARILHACGYNVAEDYIVEFSLDDLEIAEGAEVKSLFGDPIPLTRELLERNLGKVNVGRDGSIRGLASRFVEGTPLGGWSREGVRADDPNDTVPHEYRRDLRGAHAIFAWLSHTDMKEDNSLDVWVEDPEDPGVHYVKHYLIDFGKSLGVQEAHGRLKYLGHAYVLDFAEGLKSLVSLGLYRRSWEGRWTPPLRGVGLYSATHYRPDDWVTYTPSHFPTQHADRFDNFWGAKIIIRFTEPMLRAIVGEAKLSDPRSVDYMVETLVARQRKTASYWFNRVNPLDAFEVSGDHLCFDDLAVRYRLDRMPSRYRARAFDAEGAPLRWRASAERNDGARVCLGPLVPSASPGGYTIIELRTERAGRRLPPTLVHLAKNERGALRVIGIRRL